MFGDRQADRKEGTQADRWSVWPGEVKRGDLRRRVQLVSIFRTLWKKQDRATEEIVGKGTALGLMPAEESERSSQFLIPTPGEA